MPEHVALLVDFTSHIHGVAEKNLSLLRAKSTINLDSRQSETASVSAVNSNILPVNTSREGGGQHSDRRNDFNI